VSVIGNRYEATDLHPEHDKCGFALGFMSFLDFEPESAAYEAFLSYIPILRTGHILLTRPL